LFIINNLIILFLITYYWKMAQRSQW